MGGAPIVMMMEEALRWGGGTNCNYVLVLLHTLLKATQNKGAAPGAPLFFQHTVL